MCLRGLSGCTELNSNVVDCHIEKLHFSFRFCHIKWTIILLLLWSFYTSKTVHWNNSIMWEDALLPSSIAIVTVRNEARSLKFDKFFHRSTVHLNFLLCIRFL